MQEPLRCNMLSLVQKNMKAAQRKIHLHRIIYIASYVSNPEVTNQEERAFIIMIESNIKIINEDYCEEKITGFGLFYTGYFINIIEGAESTLVKHMKILSETLLKNLSNTPEVTRMKILFICYHINARYFTSWNGRQATPPVLLEKITPSSSPEVNARHIQNCILKLYKVSEYLKKQPQNLLKTAMDNISELCRADLPEINLLDFVLNSPGLMSMEEFLKAFFTVPDCILYNEVIWPLPPDFVPNKILEDSSKQLMSIEEPSDKSLDNDRENEETNEVEINKVQESV